MITKKQKEILDFIKAFSKKRGYSPSIPEIAKHFKRAVGTVHEHVQKLQGGGYLRKEENRRRGIEISKKEKLVKVPLLGTIAAGEPIEAIEVPDEAITVTKDEIGKEGQHYALRVQGNSMIEEGIFDGDIVVIREQKTADNGQMVVAIIDDNEATLKKLYREKKRFRLQSANPALFPIYRDEVAIRGIVVKIIRNLETQIEIEKEKSNEKYSRRIDYSWDYRGENTKTYTHGIHTYPAMFIPQVARRLLETYSKEGDTICDIFCGSGTALVESRVLGRNAYGVDLNPLAIFLAKAKTTPINPHKLTKTYFNLLDRVEKITDSRVKRPEFKNLDFWFKDKVIVKLAKLKKAIQEIEDRTIRDFLMVALSETVRLSSNTRPGEFKLFRISRDKLEKHNPDVFGIFRKRAAVNIVGAEKFYKEAKRNVWTKVIFGDSSKDNGIKENSIDCIITSPPYGDSHTTVAYGQFSRLSAQWIDIFDDPNEASGVDNELLGGRAAKTLAHVLPSSYLNDSLGKIAKKDEGRARDVLSFYIGLNDCLKRAYKILKPKKYFCLVIGNRLVKEVRIPTDFILAELGEKIGFSCEDIFVRNIPGKRMPLKNSPTNIAGALEETMNKESVVILRKN